MPFGRDTRVVPINIVLDRGPVPLTGRGDLGSPIAKLLWPLSSVVHRVCTLTVIVHAVLVM